MKRREVRMFVNAVEANIRTGNIDGVLAMIAELPAVPEDCNRWSALNRLVWWLFPTKVRARAKEVLSLPINVRGRDMALIKAFALQDLPTIRALFQLGFPVRDTVIWGGFSDALNKGNMSMLIFLVDEIGADVNQCVTAQGGEITILDVAVLGGRPEPIRYLIHRGAKITPLSLAHATSKGKIEVVKLLLENGADANAYCSRYRATPFQIVLKQARIPNCEAIVQAFEVKKQER